MRGDGVKKLNDLFQKYKQSLVAPEGSVKKEAVEVVSDLLGIDISSNDFDYKPYDKVLCCKAKGLLKNEILLHQKEILLHLKGRLGEKNAPQKII